MKFSVLKTFGFHVSTPLFLRAEFLAYMKMQQAFSVQKIHWIFTYKKAEAFILDVNNKVFCFFGIIINLENL
jgi:hypothetical protein